MRRLPGLLPVLLLAACQAAPGTAGGDGAPPVRLAVLPFRGVEAPAELVGEIRERLVEALAARGSEVLAGREVEEALRSRRIRVIDTLPPEEARVLAAELDAALVTGTLLMARDDPEPELSLLLRFYDREGRRTGSLAWSRRASEEVDLLGLGAPESLQELFAMELPELVAAAVAGWAPPPPGPSPVVAVLPFASAPGAPDSGTQGSVLLAHLLEERYDVRVVEPGDLQRAFLRARIRSLALMNMEDFQRLAAATGARWFIRGQLLESVAGRGPSDPPRVTLVLQIFDAEALRTVASCCVDRSGDEGEIILGIGQAFHPVRNLARALRAGLDRLGEPWASS